MKYGAQPKLNNQNHFLVLENEVHAVYHYLLNGTCIYGGVPGCLTNPNVISHGRALYKLGRYK